MIKYDRIKGLMMSFGLLAFSSKLILSLSGTTKKSGLNDRRFSLTYTRCFRGDFRKKQIDQMACGIPKSKCVFQPITGKTEIGTRAQNKDLSDCGIQYF